MAKKGSSPARPSSPVPPISDFEREFPGGSESANACVRALFTAFADVSSVMNKATRQHGLSPAGRQALAILEGAGQPLSPTSIAERLMVTTASMTSLLDTLERRALVTRLPDPDDRRRQLVSLTDEGRRSVDAFLPEIVAIQTAMMEGLSETERTRLLRTLATIRTRAADIDVDAVVAAVPPRGTPRRS